MNYYKILEVDIDASPEVIEKAYKTLVKKYHPDLQESNLKDEYEEKIKIINEAYETLSNPNLRAKYDETLKEKELTEEDSYNLSKENEALVQENLQKEYQEQLNYENQILKAKQKAYYDAYIQDLKNRGYKIRYKKTPKDYLKNFIALIITVVILFILYQIPFVKNFINKMINDNTLIQSILNAFK